MSKFPAATFARTLTERERAQFLAMPLLKVDPVRAVRSFKRRLSKTAR